MKIVTDERCTGYEAWGHPERPERITRSLDLLRRQKDLKITWDKPVEVQTEVLRRAHDPSHLAHVRSATTDFDGDTPHYPGIFEHALRSVGGALQAMQTARGGEAAFSLMRPPGHHATRSRAMGFCYFNSLACAVLEALALGTSKVAVYDFDVHHGNGTEAILLNRPKAAFFSIHQYPCYPGTGAENVGENCFNYPVAPRTPRRAYREVLKKALTELQAARPALVAVSAGFDAYAHDPLAAGTLEGEDYHWLGQSLRAVEVPVFAVLEGGYSDDLPDLILAFLKGLAGQ
jgi:acetoin utilization deacetylase AcuC-like enzyme